MKQGRFDRWLLGGLFLLVGVVWWQLIATPRIPLVAFLDIGQGDATYLRQPSGEDILIDGGPGSALIGALGEVMPLGDQELSLVVITHPHRDHMEGILALLDTIAVRELWYTGIESDTSLDDTILAKAKERGVLIRSVRAGEVKVVDAGTPFEATLRVLFPTDVLVGRFVDNPNNASLVMKYSIGDDCIIFPGDLETELLNQLSASRKEELDCDVVKASHHGSRNGTTQPWLAATSPKEVIISSGVGNTYGHPHPEMLKLVGESGGVALRTDQLGTIIAKYLNGEWQMSQKNRKLLVSPPTQSTPTPRSPRKDDE